MTERTSEDILKSAILLEKRGRAFYKKVASQTEHAATREFFQMMADEEKTHVEILARQYRSLMDTGGFATAEPNPEDIHDEVATQVLCKQMRKELGAADFEAAAISAAMSMEQRAIDLYTRRAKEATDEKEKALYQWLVDWEQGHLTFLAEVDQELREDVWNDQNFWPY
ncbi:MAG: ferritin family protein [Planctomycetota bacterium]